jgi:hypothetical protein
MPRKLCEEYNLEMPPVTTQPVGTARKASPAEIAQYTGEVVYLYAFDVAYEIVRRPIQNLLGQPVAQFVVDASKRSPRQLFFYRPQMVRMPPLERLGPQGPVRIERSIKLLPIGAISITVRVPFVVHDIEELVAFHDLQFSSGTWLYDEVRALATEVLRELKPYLVHPVQNLTDEEAYTVFCIKGPLTTPDGRICSSEDWLLENRRRVAALLTEERDPSRLAEQEADESTAKYLSYYDRDLVVVDWDAALVIDEPRYFDETLYLMELANVQLAELEAYDRMLDDAVERSYRDVTQRHFRLGQNSRVQRELREIRIDLARLSDELSNITKFFGDWHSARIYQALSARFHLADWHHTIDQKLKTLDDLYQLLSTERNTRWMFILEISVVLLFVIDLVMLAFGHK